MLGARGDRVGQPLRPVVEPVVVRDRGGIDPRGAQRVECDRRRPEVVQLRLHGLTAVGDRRLEVDDGDVGRREHGCGGREQRRRVGQELAAQRSLEVHVAAEGERDRLAVATVRVTQCGRRGRRRPPRRGRSTRRHGGAVVTSGDEPRAQSGATDDDERADDHEEDAATCAASTNPLLGARRRWSGRGHGCRG